MPLARKTTPSVLPEELTAQITNNFKKETEQPVITEEKVIKTESVKDTKSKYADVVNLRLTSGKRNEFKKFFTDCEISMNQGFEMAVDYLQREVKLGHIKVSKSGITKLDEI